MKLSISWIFSHIDADWKKIDIKNLVDKFNKTTAEIESFTKIQTDLTKLFIATVTNIENENVILYCPEIKSEIELPARENVKKDQIYLLRKEDKIFYSWAKSTDLGAEKEMLLPPLYIEPDLINGKWKNNFETEDYILEVDNKSVTHRPDLWGHRGFAREIAAFLDLKLKPIDKFIISKTVIKFDEESKSNEANPFQSSIKNSDFCKRFATLYIKQFDNKASSLLITTRLSRIDARALNAVIDATNYVMFDLSQPMHAFDADKIDKAIMPRLAKSGEKLILLDNETLELNKDDLIISDNQKPVALAGIMGGKNAEVNDHTKSLLIESANFNATKIRLTSLKYKKRTEASARFEKSLDPNQNVLAIERFLEVLKLSNVEFQASNDIISLGKETETKIININNEFIEKRLGTKIDPEFVVKTLTKLEFHVKNNNGNYEIIVPTFRSTKDILIPEDIVEEIGRFFGYGNIAFELPLKQMAPSDLRYLTKLRKLKQTLANACQMHEVQNYPFFDESFLNELSWEPKDPISVINPVSENWKKLVTSLIPHLIKNIQQNLTKQDELYFFEFNRIWHLIDNKAIEKKSLAGIFFSHSKIDFYESKSKLNTIFDLLKIKVDWAKCKNTHDQVWYSKYQTADLIYKDKKIGMAGNISQEFLNKITKGEAFIFELEGDFLLEYSPEEIRFKPLPKYPVVWLDISVFVNLEKTVEEISKIIKDSDSQIFKVELLDRFEKDEWVDKKSLTFRYYFKDDNKTLSKDEIDKIADTVNSNVKKIGAQLR